MPRKGIKILQVEKGSAAGLAGLEPGDRILEIDGHEAADELALRFYLAGGEADLRVRRADGHERLLAVELPDGVSLGVEVEEFQTRRCRNACIFCFVDRLPPGVRPSLRVKDDDFRLSFLHGNYITLTNLGAGDIERIVRERLTPLYVSVHATDPDLRNRILGRKRSCDLMGRIRHLAANRITLHAQIVLMPGINDGRHLEKTISDLYGLYPGVRSAAVVPLGLSDYGPPGDRLRPVTPAFCRRTVLEMRPWQQRFRSRTGETFVHLADEFYIQGGLDIPGADSYDDFAQIEDGVGMARVFLDAFETEWKRRRTRLPLRGTLVTGKLFCPFLEACTDRLNRKFGSRLRVRMATNSFLGKRITVAGLLGGRDILGALEGGDLGDFVIVPQEALARPSGMFLDDLAPAFLAASVGRPVYPGGSTVREFFRLLARLASGRPPSPECARHP